MSLSTSASSDHVGSEIANPENNRKRKRDSNNVQPRRMDFVRRLKGSEETSLQTLGSMMGRLRSSEATTVPNVEEKSKSDNTALKEALVIFGPKCTAAANGNYLVDGMSTPITGYQLIGAAFMLRHERSRQDPHGGILADEMGVGKTLQSIACIMAHPAPKTKKDSDDGTGVTLIVLPSEQHIRQWQSELKKHIVDGRLKESHQYKTSDRLPSFALRSFDVIFTTYNQVRDAHKKNATLYELKFLRVILDEGDKIRNSNAATSIACGDLQARYKWVLSGTPLHNNLDDVLAYTRFIGVDLKANTKMFEQCFGALKEDTQDNRLLQFLRNRMIRREKNECFLGRPICELPPYHISVEAASMSPEEDLIYKFVQTSMKVFLQRSREFGRRHFEFIGRLRQAADHPFLIESYLTTVDKETIQSLKDKLDGRSSPLFDQMKKVCDEIIASLPDSSEAEPGDNPNGLGDHVDSHRTSPKNEACIECLDTSCLIQMECGHAICFVCLTQTAEEGIFRCVDCNKTMRMQLKMEEHGSRRQGKALATPQDRDLSAAVPGADYHGKLPKFQNRFLAAYDTNDSLTIPPSAKTASVLKIVQSWQNQAPDDKIIVYVQYAGTANILGRMFQAEGLNFLYYWGDLCTEDRTKALTAFEHNSDIKIMITGLKCGSTGLNITYANRIISVSPWWNGTIEQQAFGRVYRYGQTSETYCHRIFTVNTVDERITELQKQKEEDISPALAAGKKPALLTHEEYLFLLGHNED